MSPPLHVIIAGGGIAGLATGLALGRIGCKITVLEQAHELRELGVGIQLSPNGVGVLTRLGLLDAVDALGWRTVRAAKYSIDGVPVRARDSGLPGGYAHPQIAVHRGRLQLLLARTLRAEAGEEAIRTGQRVVDFEQDTSGITVRSLDRVSGQHLRLQGDLLIGADGIHSMVRQRFYPELRPDYTGYVIWRGQLPIARYEDERRTIGQTTTYGDMHRFFNYYFMNDTQMSFSVCCRVEASEQVSESWSAVGTADEIRALFGDCTGPLEACLTGMTTLMKMYVHDHETIPRWSFPGVTMVGDAAHAMLPFAGQGAVSALEDAELLAAELDGASDAPSIEQACERYEQARRPPTSRVRDYCRERGGIFEEFLVLDAMTDGRWATMPTADKRAFVADVDWSKRETFLRSLY